MYRIVTVFRVRAHGTPGFFMWPQRLRIATFIQVTAIIVAVFGVQPMSNLGV